MADISALQNLASTEPLDWENYPEAQEAAPLPPKGRYTFRVADTIVFEPTKAGDLSARIDPVIVGPTHEGRQLKFTRVSAKAFKRGGATVSQMGDFLRACGSTERPRTAQELADAVERCAGRTFQADIDWEAYNSEPRWSLKGMEKFPLDANGEPSPWVKVPLEGVDKTVHANAKIDRFVSAS